MRRIIGAIRKSDSHIKSIEFPTLTKEDTRTPWI